VVQEPTESPKKRQDEMFEVGDAVVYLSYGVARIISLKEEKIQDSRQLCLVLETAQGALIKLPVEKAETALRRVVEEGEVSNVIQVLRKRGMKVDSEVWSRRLRDYKEKMRTGNIFSVAEIFRDLTLRKRTKDLSYSERKLLDQARSLLINELSIANKAEVSETERTVDEILSK
jgi:CarD family transcriptional regulator